MRAVSLGDGEREKRRNEVVSALRPAPRPHLRQPALMRSLSGLDPAPQVFKHHPPAPRSTAVFVEAGIVEFPLLTYANVTCALDGDLLQRFQAIGDESRAEHVDALAYAFTCPVPSCTSAVYGCSHVAVAEAGLERERPLLRRRGRSFAREQQRSVAWQKQ